jgi:hypothetical protein
MIKKTAAGLRKGSMKEKEVPIFRYSNNNSNNGSVNWKVIKTDKGELIYQNSYKYRIRYFSF